MKIFSRSNFKLMNRHISASPKVIVTAISVLVSFAGTANAADVLYKCTDLSAKSKYISYGPKLVQGVDGWFFRSSELEMLFEFSGETLEAIEKINSALSYRGTKLVFLPIVPKGIASGKFIPNNGILDDKIYDQEMAGLFYSEFIKSLSDRVYKVVDIASILKGDPNFESGDFFFKRDLHWKPDGARLIASAVARLIASEGVPGEDVNFTTELVEAQRRYKSQFMIMINEVCDDKIPPEVVDVFETKRVVDSLDALLGDDVGTEERPTVHIVGSSFTAESEEYNFSGFLRQALKRDVDVFSLSGGGINQSLYWWAQNPTGNGRNPRYLLWEVPNLNDFPGLAREMKDTIVPAIIGECAGDLLVLERNFDEASEFEFELSDLSGEAGELYVSYSFENRALTSFVSSYSYADKTEKRVRFNNPTRVSGLTKLYQEIPQSEHRFPAHVRLDFGGGAKTAGSVKLCRYPKGIFGDETTSN